MATRQSGATVSTKTKFAHSIQHNNRDTEPSYLLPKEYQNTNEYLTTSKDSFSTYHNEMKERTKKYVDRTGQKLQKKSAENISIILNLNEHHTLENIKPIIDYIQTKLDTVVYNGAIHRDEGYIDDDKKVHYNYHSHLEMLPLDSQGNSVTRKIKKQFLKDLQKFVSQALQMEYTPYQEQKRQGKTPTKRLDTHEYRIHKQKENQELKRLTKNNDLELFEKFNEELEKNNFKKIDNTKINQAILNAPLILRKKENEVKEYKEKIKQLEKNYNELQNTKLNGAEYFFDIFRRIAECYTDIKDFSDIAYTEDLDKIRKFIVNVPEKIKTLNETNQELQAQIEQYKQTITKLENRLYGSKEEEQMTSIQNTQDNRPKMKF